MKPLTKTEAKRLVKKHGSIRAAANATGRTYNSIQKVGGGEGRPARKQTVSERTGKIAIVDPSGRRDRGAAIRAKRTTKAQLPKGSKIKFYLFTTAQNGTKVHAKLWDNLVAYADWLGASIHVARTTYKKSAYSAQHTKTEKLYDRTEKDLWWDERVVGCLDDSRLEVAPGLVWCGDVDILPTAEKPLQGLETFTGRASSIFPHMKQDFDSVPSNKFEPTKFVYTTGAVTLRNYIQRKVGQKAEFHHHYGALLVSVDEAGNWFVRQINADSTGTFYDLIWRVKDGEVTEVPVEKNGARKGYSIYWSDGHEIEADEEMVNLAFGSGGFKDFIRPEKDFQGDIISFKSRNHHDISDPHRIAIIHARKQNSVFNEVGGAADWLWRMHRDYCETYAVYGNHERAIGKYLKNWNAHQIFDPTNAEYYARLQAETFAFIKEHKTEPNFFQLALEVGGFDIPPSVRFLLEDESVIVNQDANGGIECGAHHGDRGPGGKPGTVAGFLKMGRKVNIGDKHAACKKDGVCVSGTFSSMEKVDWVHGPCAWSCTQILDLPNGKRQMVTFWNGMSHHEPV